MITKLISLIPLQVVKCQQSSIITCTCLQSWPRAGKPILRYVIGHFRDSFIRFCSLASFSKAPEAGDSPGCINVRLTANNTSSHTFIPMYPTYLQPIKTMTDALLHSVADNISSNEHHFLCPTFKIKCASVINNQQFP